MVSAQKMGSPQDFFELLKQLSKPKLPRTLLQVGLFHTASYRFISFKMSPSVCDIQRGWHCCLRHSLPSWRNVGQKTIIDKQSNMSMCTMFSKVTSSDRVLQPVYIESLYRIIAAWSSRQSRAMNLRRSARVKCELPVKVMLLTLSKGSLTVSLSLMNDKMRMTTDYYDNVTQWPVFKIWQASSSTLHCRRKGNVLNWRRSSGSHSRSSSISCLASEAKVCVPLKSIQKNQWSIGWLIDAVIDCLIGSLIDLLMWLIPWWLIDWLMISKVDEGLNSKTSAKTQDWIFHCWMQPWAVTIWFDWC